MDKMGKKLTDRDLINQVVAWYKLDQSTDQLREAIGRYIKQNASVSATASDEVSHEEPAPQYDERTPAFEDAEDAEGVRVVSKPRFGNNGFESKGVKYEPQFEPTDELIQSRRWGIDVWALYYGTEDFFQRISFGLLSMQSLAALFCILVLAAVMFGAWQSNLSNERRKTATFKSMEIESADKMRTTRTLADEEPSPTEIDSSEVNATHAEQSPNALATSIDKPEPAGPEPTQASPEPLAVPESAMASPEPVATAPESMAAPAEPVAATAEPVATSSDVVAATPELEKAPELVTAPNLAETTPATFESKVKEFEIALNLMDQGAWKEARGELQKLERRGQRELQPLLTLLQIETLIRIHDTASMESARQLLMDCKFGEYDVVYDLLVARWILGCGAEDRRRFLNASSLLPESMRERMCAWAQIRNSNKDERTALTLQSYASQGPSYVCDLLFIASFHYNVNKYDDAYRELLETQQKLNSLETSGKNRVDCWLLVSAKDQLAENLARILKMAAAKRTQVN